ncbi:YdiU family protein [Alsobacter sp. SYSU M60028]|uniref:Protein nucleotidyltransferase YdiU n=1 Tax=Alsobacter ponti TaxID=2962936 RepID=A0ABT1LG09_9HYPH|nr:YdiU family protein [Alsobacter ponti]MCP8939833.1 YdiU family protein [Alsobacter ponti]
MTIQFPFDNLYARMPAGFFARVEPTPTQSPRLVQLNRALAIELGLDPDALDTPEGAEILAGKRIPEVAEPLAMAYAGHQFGHFVPQLGDGRAILLGEVVDRAGERRDIQLKGSGPTPYSRNGDGRAALGPVLREYLVSEAMHALGIPTTRALAAATTGEQVYRETALPGAVLTRVASSHIRVGTFQFFAARGRVDALRQLADHAIARHYPDAAQAASPYRALLEGVAARQGRLVAQWLLVGFIHGVMNTDNMSVAGETIDYGPCAFMDAYDPRTVFSSIDQFGRYAYANQPGIAQWNLARLAECLLPLLDPNEEAAVAQAQEALGAFADAFNEGYLGGLRRKLGLLREQPDDIDLAQALFSAMAAARADFTLTFRRLADAALGPQHEAGLRGLFGSEQAALDEWLAVWRDRLAAEDAPAETRRAAMLRASPAVIPRNHRVEAALSAAIERDDYAPFEEMARVLADPYAESADASPLAQPPAEDRSDYRTFCGT